MLRLRGLRSGEAAAELRPASSSVAPEGAEAVVPEASLAGGLIRAAVCWRADGLLSPTAPFQMAGRDVAAASFTAAIALHGKTAAADVFAPHADLDACRQQLESATAATGDDLAHPLSLFPEGALLGRMENAPYDVLHGPTDFPRLSYFRSRFSARVFPITSTSMGLSYSFDIHRYYLRLLAAQFYPCDALVCPTRSAVSALEKRLLDLADRFSHAWEGRPPAPPPLHCIPWGVDTARFVPRSQAMARRDLDLPVQRRILLCVGRMNLHDKMDLAPLLLAFDGVCRTAKERPLLVLAGAPSDYVQRVLAFASQLGLRDDLRTFFACPPACLPSLYAACDVVVAPTDSPSETFGLTVAEAMASGRPVVASDWDGYKELIVHGETGFKARTDWADCLSQVSDLAPFLPWDQEHLHVGQSVSIDVPQLVRYLSRLLADPHLRAEMGRRARARAEELYSWPVVIAQWEALWRELVAISRTIERREPHRLEYLTPNYFQHFSHFASRIIDDEVPVKLTPRGKEALAAGTPLPVDPCAQGFLRADILLAVLTAIKPAGWIGAGLLVGDLVRLLRQSRGLSQPQILMHLMWLAKYDLVSLGGAELEADGQ